MMSEAGLSFITKCTDRVLSKLDRTPCLRIIFCPSEQLVEKTIVEASMQKLVRFAMVYCSICILSLLMSMLPTGGYNHMSCAICDHFRAAIAKDIFGSESLVRLKAEFREHLAYKVTNVYKANRCLLFQNIDVIKTLTY